MIIKLPTNINPKDVDKVHPFRTCSEGESVKTLGCVGIECNICALHSKENFAMYLKEQEPETEWALARIDLIPQQALNSIIYIELCDNEILVMIYSETNKPVLKTDDHLKRDIDFSGRH